jgi:putative hydrolase of the HAD superfamily
MRIQAIMVDVDGVLVVPHHAAGWSVHLERDLGVSAKDLQKCFFNVHWADIICGRTNLRECLTPVLLDLAPHLSCSQLIDYWFSHDAELNLDLLSELDVLRTQGIGIHLATVQEHERAHFLWEHLGMRNHFDGLHYAADLGCAKPDLAFFRVITERTGYLPDKIFFIDDRNENVEGARKAGWIGALWTPQMKLADLINDMELSK